VGCTARSSLFDMTVTTEPVAVGASATGQLQSRTCSETDCDFATVKILSMDVTPPGVFDTPSAGTTPGTFAIPALAEGTATFTVTGNDGDDTRTFTRDLGAVAANRVTGAFAYERTTCPTPVVFGPGLQVQMPFEVWRDDTKLFSFGFTPFVVEGAPIREDLSVTNNLTLMLPGQPATVTVSSTIDPSFQTSVEVIDATAIDGIALSGPDEPLQILDVAALTVEVSAAGRVVCNDNISRTATTLTPTVCKIKGPTPRDEWVSAGMHEIQVTGVGAGTCTITVTNAITGPTAMTSFQVAM
jgi:hypothetical protein